MKLSKTERWMLANQYKILEHLDPDQADHYQKMQEILERGYEIEYDWNTEYIYDDVLVEEKSLFIIHTLSLYDALQRSYNTLTDVHIDEIQPDSVVFPGFDGNNEGEYLSYANFLVEREEKFAHLKLGSDGMNSHMPVVDRYQRMYLVWSQFNKSYQLSREQIVAILSAQTHPDNLR